LNIFNIIAFYDKSFKLLFLLLNTYLNLFLYFFIEDFIYFIKGFFFSIFFFRGKKFFIFRKIVAAYINKQLPEPQLFVTDSHASPLEHPVRQAAVPAMC